MAPRIDRRSTKNHGLLAVNADTHYVDARLHR